MALQSIELRCVGRVSGTMALDWPEPLSPLRLFDAASTRDHLSSTAARPSSGQSVSSPAQMGTNLLHLESLLEKEKPSIAP